MIEYISKFYTESDYPALADQCRRWSVSKPFAGVRILDGTPVFRNTLTKYVPLIAAGAKLSVAISGKILYDKAIVEFLRLHNVDIYNADSKVCPPGKFDIVLDCAGINMNVPAEYGYVELTKSGVHRYYGLPFPVMAADESKIKEIETVLGTGDGFYRAMIQDGFGDFKGRKIVVVGCGKVGKGVAMYAQRAGAEVWAVDDFSRAVLPMGAHAVDMHDAAAIESAMEGAWCVVSVTGIKDAWVGKFNSEKLLASRSIIVNMGVEDEFGSGIPDARVMNHKQPYNFKLEEPTRLKYLEATLALHNAAGVELLKGNAKPGINKVPRVVEEEILNCSIENGKIGTEIKELGLL